MIHTFTRCDVLGYVACPPQCYKAPGGIDVAVVKIGVKERFGTKKETVYSVLNIPGWMAPLAMQAKTGDLFFLTNASYITATYRDRYDQRMVTKPFFRSSGYSQVYVFRRGSHKKLKSTDDLDLPSNATPYVMFNIKNERAAKRKVEVTF